MDFKLRKVYIITYTFNKKFIKVIEYLKEYKRVSEDGDVIFLKFNYLFFIKDSFIYN